MNATLTTAKSAVAGQVIATYPSYEEAQRAIDLLSDSGFPVGQTAIVGRDLRLVEQVTGRLTMIRATLMGAASGAWFGLFVGFVLTLFETGTDWIGFVALTAAIGAVWGGIFGFVAHWATGGRRDFDSTTAIVAGGYDVTTDAASSERATQLLSSPG